MNPDSDISPTEEKLDSPWCSIRRSGVHGRGLFAKKKIKEGTKIIEYVGEKIDKEESNRRGWDRIGHAQQTGDAAVYIFTLNDTHDIDGSVSWNPARLINHSCSPNCEAYIEDDEIWIGALRDIKKGEELSYNYGFDLENWKDHPCHCGSENCVGYIAGEEYWPDLKKKIARRDARKKRR